MKLQGMNAFVAGATGQIGMGAAFALSAHGATVYLSGRNATKLANVQKTLPNDESHIVAVDYSTVEGAQKLQEAVEGLPPFDIVVASSGAWCHVTQLHGADHSLIQRGTAANFQAHANLFSVLAPKTKRYIVVNGAASLAIAQTGFTGVLANAVTGLTKMMNQECKKNPKFPALTHALIKASVGHDDVRRDTMDKNQFGNVFAAMALDIHEVDSEATVVIDESMAESLIASLQ